MLVMDARKTAQTEWASSIVLVSNNEGTPSFCIDYIKFIVLEIQESYLAPLIEECIDLLAMLGYSRHWTRKADTCSLKLYNMISARQNLCLIVTSSSSLECRFSWKRPRDDSMKDECFTYESQVEIAFVCIGITVEFLKSRDKHKDYVWPVWIVF